jgi:hypothetical protein
MRIGISVFVCFTLIANSAVLASSGETLWETVSQSDTISLEGVQFVHCIEFLKYIYGAKVNMSNEVLEIAEKLKVLWGYYGGNSKVSVDLADVQESGRRTVVFEKLYKDPIYSDVTLIVEGNKIKAHRYFCGVTTNNH